ncbi:MAG: hypothetical protein ACI4U3_01905, partial [Traorella sp.]
MKNVLFDLDGTLLPMDVEEFTKRYFGLILKVMNENKRDGKLILDAIGKGVYALVKNDGKLTNEELFWKTFSSVTAISREEIEPEFQVFYETMFDLIDTKVQNLNMVEAVQL